MPSAVRPDRVAERSGFVPALLGVVRLGWDPATLVAVYVAELLVPLPLAGVAALFIERPPRTGRDASTVGAALGCPDVIGSDAALAVGPWPSAAELIGRLLAYGPFAAVMGAPSLRFTWNLACPD